MIPSLDTNCLLRWVLDDIHAQAILVENLINKRQVYVADEVIIEMAYVLEKSYKLPRDAVADYIQLVTAHHNMLCNRALINSILSMYCKHTALSFTDCFFVVKASVEQKTPLYTFDKKLATQAVDAQLLT